MSPDREVGHGPGGQGESPIDLTCLHLFLNYVYIVDDRRDQPLQGESNFGDSSGPFFSIYSKAAEDEDIKMIERWQKDADGILIFVSPLVGIHLCI